MHLWIDAGLKDEDDLDAPVDLDHTTIVVGLETAAGPDAVRAVLDRTDSSRVVLSLDLFEGVPRLTKGADWAATGLEGLSRQILDLGGCRLLLLDLARVGTGRGTGTGELHLRLRESRPAVEVSVGGGISGIEELIAVRTAGAAAALIGSALHDGRIGREELARLSIAWMMNLAQRRGTRSTPPTPPSQGGEIIKEAADSLLLAKRTSDFPPLATAILSPQLIIRFFGAGATASFFLRRISLIVCGVI